MPEWLSDPPASRYWLLAALLILTVLIGLQRRQRLWWFLALGSGFVLVLLFLADYFGQSPREEAVQRMQAIIQAVQHRQPETCILHVADTISYQGEHSQAIQITREQLRQAPFWHLLRQFDVQVYAWDFAREDVTRPDPHTVEIGFLAKGEAEGKQVPFYIRAAFTQQADGTWKLSRLQSFDPLKRQKERRSIPGFPP
jgi:hypothetical protein